MALEKWIKKNDELLVKNPYWECRKARFVLPSGKETDYFYMHHSGGVMAVAVNKEGKIPMVRQYRALIDRFSIEFPAGGIEPGADPLEAAIRELAEETKLGAKEIEFVGNFYMSHGVSDQKGTIFLATELFVSPKAEDATEDLELLWFTPTEIDEMIADQTIKDGWVLSAWILTRNKVIAYISMNTRKM